MTNVITFKKPDPTSRNVEDFVIWLQLLRAHANRAHAKITAARSLDKALAYYSEWLRRYWEMNGAVESLWRHLERHIQVHGREIDADRADDIAEFMATVEGRVKGPHPWLSLPNFERTKLACLKTLDDVTESLTRAMGKAQAVGRPTHSPDERTSA